MTNEELQQKVKRLEEELIEVRIALLESKADKKPYEVEVPEDIETYYTINARGELQSLNFYPDFIQECIYKRGEAFEISDNAVLYDKEKLLLKRMEDWTEEHNEGWTPDWEDCDDKFYITYHHGLSWFKVCSNMRVDAFNKLPYFKSEEIAREFIEVFGEEIKEVLC